MISRKIEHSINEWILHSKNALMVTGARQVGKTFSIRECLRKNDCHYIELNLIEHPEFIPALEQSISAHDLAVNLSLLAERPLQPGESIIFIDEVQQCKELVTKMKFWVDDASFRFVLSGSLLGVELFNLRSAPVGYLDEVTMYPLDFEEFLCASGVNEDIIDELRASYVRRKPVPELLHAKLMEHFRRYLVIGGMPAAVQEYVTSGDVNQVMRIQQNILTQYKRDFTKYEKTEKKLMLVSVFEHIPSELLKQNHRYSYADIQKGLRFERVESSFLWLNNAGGAIPVYNTTEPRISLAQNKKNSLLKLYMSDVGLLTCAYGKSAKQKLLSNAQNLNRGGIYENAVVQELSAHGYAQYFYRNHRLGELDFVIEHDGAVVPIEVKIGKDYYTHSALNHVLENREYDIREAFVLADCNLHAEGRVLYLPVYLCMFIQDETVLPVLAPLG